MDFLLRFQFEREEMFWILLCRLSLKDFSTGTFKSALYSGAFAIKKIFVSLYYIN